MICSRRVRSFKRVDIGEGEIPELFPEYTPLFVRRLVEFGDVTVSQL